MNKAKKERERLHRQRVKLAEEAKLEASYQKLRNKSSGFTLVLHDKPVIPERKKASSQQLPIREFGTLPKSTNTADPVYQKTINRLSPEMQVREDKAKQVAHARKAFVIPLYNKGPYGLATSQDMEAFKNGELRRR